MSVSSEVKRTLVKSPPELWAELSDPDALARHLGELGEIRIVRTEPEQAVEWEAPLASGTVRIEPSGWGTKVTLTATRAVPQDETETETETETEAETEAETVAEDQSGTDPEADTVTEAEPGLVFDRETPPSPEPDSDLELEEDWEVEPELTSEPVLDFEPDLDFDPDLDEPQPWLEAEPAVEPKPEWVTPIEPPIEPEPRQGFFARLFRRRHTEHPQLETPIERDSLVESTFDSPFESGPPVDLEPEAELEPFEPLAELEISPEPPYEPGPGEDDVEQEIAPDGDGPKANDLAAELAELEEQTAAVLVGVLDRLGAAHHRPFSRA